MGHLTNKEYMDLLEEIIDAEFDDEPVIEELESEKDILKKRFPKSTSVINLTDTKLDKIQDEVLKHTNFRVGPFKIRIKKYSSIKYSEISVDLEIWEEKDKTPSGHPCRIDYPIYVTNDTRFNNQQWISYFKWSTGKTGHDVPLTTVTEIIRWLQAINRIAIFL